MAIVLPLLFVPSLLAQTAATGALTGTVTDASGGVIPNATVTLTSLDTGQVRTANTDAAGTYRFVLLNPGTFKVSFAAPGFKTDEVPSVTVNVTETPTLNRSLQVGGQAEQVTVSENVEAIQTASSAMGTVVESKAVTDLPLTTRNYTNLLGLSAGANANVPNATALGRGTMEIAVNGASTAQNTYLMDGVSIVNVASSGVDTEGGTYATFGIPNPDSLAEFKIQTSLYDAGYGRNPGANVNVITKSGTNEFHGTAFEFFRNTVLNANDFFRNRNCGVSASSLALCQGAGGVKQVLNQNQFGGVIGGPIKKDKIFFFSSYQQTWQKNGIASQGNISTNLPALPLGDRTTAAWQAALGAQFCPANHPGSTAFTTAAAGAASTQVACDGSNINPIALKLLAVQNAAGSVDGPYAMPGNPAGAVAGAAPLAVTYSLPAYDREYQGLANFDWLINSKNTLTEKYFQSSEPQLATVTGLPGISVLDPFGYNDGVIKLTTIISSSVVNELRGSLQHTSTLPYESGVPAGSYASSIYGSPQGCNLLGCALPYSPIVNLTGAGYYTAFGSDASDETVTNVQYQMADQVSWTHGKHSVRIGAEFERLKWNWIYKGLSRGTMTFQSFDDFLIGLPGNCGAASATCNGGTASNILNTTNFDVVSGPEGIAHAYLMRNANSFAQDDIKVNQRLTVNLGLRWEFDGSVGDKYGNVTNFWPFLAQNAGAPSTSQTPTPGQYLVPTGGSYAGWVIPTNYSISTWGTPPAGVLSTGHNIPIQGGTPLTNFAPRLGFAYQPTGNNKLVVRGGAGFFYDRVPGNTIIHAVEQSPPYSITLDQSGPGQSFSSEQAPFQNIPLGTFPVRWVNFSQTNPYDQSSSVTVTSQFPKYVTPLVYSWNLNVQYEIAPTYVLEVGYVGSRGIHQAFCSLCQINEALLATPTNPINGLTTSTTTNTLLRVPILGLGPTGGQYAETNGDYKSSSLQVTLRKSLSHGLNLQAAYTWVRAFAAQDNSGDPNNQEQQYGLNPSYRPQRVTIQYSYNIPGANFKGAAGKLLGGWALSGVTTIQDGDALTCTDNRGGSIFGQNGGGALSRCQMATGATYGQITSPGGDEARLGGASGGCGWFACSTPAAGGTAITATGFSAFTTIPNVAGTNGTGWGSSGLGTFLGPGQFNFDMTLAKVTRVGGIHENATLQFRVEFYNMFNHPQFSNPTLTYNASTFGQVTSSAVNPRLVQLALKYVF
jgi:hypothetical protein